MGAAAAAERRRDITSLSLRGVLPDVGRRHPPLLGVCTKGGNRGMWSSRATLGEYPDRWVQVGTPDSCMLFMVWVSWEGGDGILKEEAYISTVGVGRRAVAPTRGGDAEAYAIVGTAQALIQQQERALAS